MIRQLIAITLAAFLFAGPAFAAGKSTTREIQAAVTIATAVDGGVLVVANIPRTTGHTAAYIVVTTTNEVNTAVLTLQFEIATPSGTFEICTPAVPISIEKTEVYMLGSIHALGEEIDFACPYAIAQGFQIRQTVTGATASFDVEISIVLLTTGGS